MLTTARILILLVSGCLCSSAQESTHWDGVPEVLVYDLTDGSHRTEIWLETSDGRYGLTGRAAQAMSGCDGPVRVRGVKQGQTIAVEAVEQLVAAIGKTSSKSAEVALCSSTGEQKAAVILLSFPGKPVSKTAAELGPAFFSKTAFSVAGFVQEASYGRSTLTGDVLGPFTLSQAYTCEESTAMASAAIALVQKSVDLTAYRRVFFVFPRSESCSYRGLSHVGCQNRPFDISPRPAAWWVSFTWLPDLAFFTEVSYHEYGHALGLRHSSTRDYGSEAIGWPGTTGEVNEGGDRSSAMGASWAQFNGPEKAALNWLSASEMQTVTGSGTFTLTPLDSSNAGLKLLKIPRTADSAYYVEYRQKTGSYNTGLDTALTTGALIHFEDPANVFGGLGTYVGRTHLLDFTPNSNSSNAFLDFADAPLKPSATTWEDPYSSKTLRVASASASALTVVVGDIPSCATVSVTSREHGAGAESGSFVVTAPAACNWSAVSRDGWVKITSAASGTGNATVSYQVAANTAAPTRESVIVVDKRVVVVRQASGMNAAPVTGALDLFNGSGSTQHFRFQWRDENGWADMKSTRLLFNTSTSLAGGCAVEMDPAAQSIRLANDAGTGWSDWKVVNYGSNPNLGNSQCTVIYASGGLSHVGDPFVTALGVTIAFRGKFAGVKNIYATATDAAGAGGTWEGKGTFAVIQTPPVMESIVSSTNSFLPGRTDFRLTLSETNGIKDLQWVRFLIGATTEPKDGCLVELLPATNEIRLANDAGNGWTSDPRVLPLLPPPNSKCQVVYSSVDPSTTIGDGKYVWFVSVTFSPQFFGAQQLWGSGLDTAGNATGWISKGPWMILPLRSPSLATLTPASGGGARQAFRIIAEDPNGAEDIRTVQFSAGSGSARCLLSLTVASRTLELSGQTATVGSGTVLTTPYCSVKASEVSVLTPTDRQVLVDLTVTFAAGLAGSVPLQVFVNDLSSRTLVQDFGNWVVPAAGTCLGSVAPLPTGFSASGGSVQSQVTVAAGCAWNWTDIPQWLSVVPAVGTGSGVVTFTAAANGATANRSGTLGFGGMSVPVFQGGSTCSYSLTASGSVAPPTAGGSGSLTLIAPTGCPWTVVSDAQWLKVAGLGSGSGSGTAGWIADPNAGPARTAIVSAAGQSVTIRQEANTCTFSAESVTAQPVHGSGGSGVVRLTTGAVCEWTASSAVDWIALPAGIKGVGPADVGYNVSPNTGAARSGTIVVAGRTLTMVGGRTFTVNQSADCNFSLSPSAITTSATGGIYNATLTLTGTQCRWAVQQPPSVTANPGEGNAPGTFSQSFTVYPNFSTQARTLSVYVGTATMTIGQSGNSLTSNERFVQLVYFAFLGRLPTAAELAAQSASLNTGTSRADMVVNFFGSQEFNVKGRFVAGLYVGLLNRDAEFNGWIFQRGALLSGVVSSPGLVTNFINGLEFQLQNGALSNENYVRVLYRQVLLREPSATEVSGQAAVLSSGVGSRTNMALGFLASPEFQGGTSPRLIAFLLYAGLLQRDPTTTERNALTAQIQAGTTVPTAALNILNSVEFADFLK